MKKSRFISYIRITLYFCNYKLTNKQMRKTPLRPLRQNLNSSNLIHPSQPQQLKDRHITRLCLTHSDKQATHALINHQTQQKIMYCQKCSIMLASKGYNIVKLSEISSAPRLSIQGKSAKTQRQSEVQSFLGELAWHIQEITKKDDQTEQILIYSEEHFSNLLTETTHYFKQLQDILQIQKYMSYNAILNHRTSLESEVRQLRQSFQQQIDQLLAIGNDIQNNIQAVETVEIDIYEQIMENYRKKASLAYEFHEIEVGSLPAPALIFPQIPKYLCTLADRINLRNEYCHLETLQKNHNQDFGPLSRPSFTNRSNNSKPQSCQNSRAYYNTSSLEKKTDKTKKTLSNFVNMKNAESIDEKQIAFSFESSHEDSHIHKILFGGDRKMKQQLHPQQMAFRQSLSLTEIRENEEEMEVNYRRYDALLEQTIPIPQEMMTSQESIADYLAGNTLKYSGREMNQRGEETETMLI